MRMEPAFMQKSMQQKMRMHEACMPSDRARIHAEEQRSMQRQRSMHVDRGRVHAEEHAEEQRSRRRSRGAPEEHQRRRMHMRHAAEHAEEQRSRGAEEHQRRCMHMQHAAVHAHAASSGACTCSKQRCMHMPSTTTGPRAGLVPARYEARLHVPAERAQDAATRAQSTVRACLPTCSRGLGLGRRPTYTACTCRRGASLGDLRGEGCAGGTSIGAMARPASRGTPPPLARSGSSGGSSGPALVPLVPTRAASVLAPHPPLQRISSLVDESSVSSDLFAAAAEDGASSLSGDLRTPQHAPVRA